MGPEMRPIDQAENAALFLEDRKHEQNFDRILWMMRVARDRAAAAVSEWEQLRDLASTAKEHVLSHLAEYLEQFEQSAKSNGVNVHWANDAHDHNQIVLDIMAKHGATTLIKSKSMLTEECETRQFLETRGILVTETDLGERIQQLDHQPPAHITGPAIQKTKEDVAAVFARNYGSDPNNTDEVYLAQQMRNHTRPLIEKAEVGMTGANFAVAETGAIVTVTNEGNADLSGNVPKVRICSFGIEKIIPSNKELALFVRLLSRSATGQAISQYTSHFRGPRKDGEMHVIIVDNGRSERLAMEKFWPSLKCIRCGACMNTCPVFRRSGGLSYGSTYMGPIGIIMMPTFDIHRYSELPFASTLNGSCTNVCPVKINIHDQIYAWRGVMDEHHQVNLAKKAALKVAGKVLSHPELYRTATTVVDDALQVLPHFAIYNDLNAWGKHRDVPKAPSQTFHQWYKENRLREN
jgi:L-lactate dehydrogenase complex protein LldF